MLQGHIIITNETTWKCTQFSLLNVAVDCRPFRVASRTFPLQKHRYLILSEEEPGLAPKTMGSCSHILTTNCTHVSAVTSYPEAPKVLSEEASDLNDHSPPA